MYDPEPRTEPREPDGPRCACCGDPIGPDDSFCWTAEQEDYCHRCTLAAITDILTPPGSIRRLADELGPIFGFLANGASI